MRGEWARSLPVHEPMLICSDLPLTDCPDIGGMTYRCYASMYRMVLLYIDCTRFYVNRQRYQPQSKLGVTSLASMKTPLTRQNAGYHVSKRRMFSFVRDGGPCPCTQLCETPDLRPT